jgi:hypothetical protein
MHEDLAKKLQSMERCIRDQGECIRQQGERQTQLMSLISQLLTLKTGDTPFEQLQARAEEAIASATPATPSVQAADTPLPVPTTTLHARKLELHSDTMSSLFYEWYVCCMWENHAQSTGNQRSRLMKFARMIFFMKLLMEEDTVIPPRPLVQEGYQWKQQILRLSYEGQQAVEMFRRNALAINATTGKRKPRSPSLAIMGNCNWLQDYYMRSPEQLESLTYSVNDLAMPAGHPLHFTCVRDALREHRK